jgi:hypothetical protein
MNFKWILLLNSKEMQRLGLEGKNSWAFNVFTLLNLEIFLFKSMKNKKCVHTWANDKSYTNQYEKEINMCMFIIWLNSIEPNYEENSIQFNLIWFNSIKFN